MQASALRDGLGVIAVEYALFEPYDAPIPGSSPDGCTGTSNAHQASRKRVRRMTFGLRTTPRPADQSTRDSAAGSADPPGVERASARVGGATRVVDIGEVGSDKAVVVRFALSG